MEEGNGVQRYSTEVSFTNFKVKQEYRFVDDLNPSTKTQSHRHHHLRNEMIDVAASSSDEEEGESRDSEDRHSDGETSVSAESILNSSSHPKDDDIEGDRMDHHCFDKEFIHDLMLIPTIVQEEPLVNEDLSHLLKTEVHDLRGSCSVPEFIQSRIVNGYETGSFLVTNLASVVKQLQQWQRELPMVEPFYAVKCNPDPNIVRLLASLGCSFDCATMGEIELVCHGLGEQLSFGNTPGKAKKSIVYANPAKMQHMLEYAIENEVGMTVFDGEDELYKIAETPGHENIQLLLRLTTDDKASICRFSKKFGCPVAEAPRLLDVAKELGLNIAGVSFHVGSGCGDAGAYATALEHARIVFEEGLKRGMPAMTVVDIGGGFPGGTEGVTPGMPTFFDLAATIRSSIADFLKVLNRPASEIRFIAEPGRYFVSESTTIATKIYSRKGGKNKYQAIYVDDGVYGSFNNVVYDHALPIPKRLNSVLANTEASDELIPTAVFGPTCDGLDQMCSLDTTTLPRCEVGEWLIWPQQGAYTHTASFVFNGYTHIPKKTYCYL